MNLKTKLVSRVLTALLVTSAAIPSIATVKGHPLLAEEDCAGAPALEKSKVEYLRKVDLTCEDVKHLNCKDVNAPKTKELSKNNDLTVFISFGIPFSLLLIAGIAHCYWGWIPY